MVFNLKFIVDGSIDTFLEKNLSSGPGARIKKIFFVYLVLVLNFVEKVNITKDFFDFQALKSMNKPGTKNGVLRYLEYFFK